MPAETHAISHLTLQQASDSVFGRSGRDSQWIQTWRTIFDRAEYLREFVDLEKERLDAKRTVHAWWNRFHLRSRSKYSVYKVPTRIFFHSELHTDCPIPAIIDDLQRLGPLDRVRLGRELACVSVVATYGRNQTRSFSDDAVVANVTKAIAAELHFELPSSQECVLLRKLAVRRHRRHVDVLRYELPSDPTEKRRVLTRLSARGIPVDLNASTLSIRRNALRRRATSERVMSEELEEPLDDEITYEPIHDLPRRPDVIPERRDRVGDIRPDIDRWKRGLATNITSVQMRQSVPDLKILVRVLLKERLTDGGPRTQGVAPVPSFPSLAREEKVPTVSPKQPLRSALHVERGTRKPPR